MGRQHPRIQRVRKLLKEEIARLIQREVKDVRVRDITVSDVKVSPDLKHATVYVQTLAGEEVASDALEGLSSAAGFIRSRLGRELHIRRVPELRFVLDHTHARAARIARLLQGVRPADEAGGDGEEGG